MQRDRAQTEQRLIDAVGQLIAEEGFEQVGINRIANRAGVNKILIYRYFGGLDGLLEAYYKKFPPIIQAPRINPEHFKEATIDEILAASCEYFLMDHRLLRQNVQAQEYLKADLFNYPDSRLNTQATRHEQETNELVDSLSAMAKSEYGRSVSAVLIMGMRMLIFMGQDKRKVMGIDLATDEGWEQIEQAIRRIFHGLALAATETQANNPDRLKASPTLQTSSNVL